MSRRGFTEKPCPMCNKPGLRLTNQVCQDCKTVYEDGLRLEAAQKVAQDKILVIRHGASHWNSHPYIFTRGSGRGVYDLNNKLQIIWHDLVVSLTKEPGIPTEGNTPFFTTNKKGLWGSDAEHFARHDDFFLASKDTYIAINNYDRIIRIALEFCYLQGKSEGLNLLMQLNEGTTSPSDFSDNQAKTEYRLSELQKMIEE